MLSSALLSVIISPITFKGGVGVDYAQFLATTWKRPAYVCSFQRISPIRIEHPESLPKFSDLNRASGLTASDEPTADVEQIAFRPKTWPIFYPNRSGMPELAKLIPPVAFKEVQISDQMVAIGGSSAAFDLGAITSKKFSRRVDIHWFLRGFKVAVSLPRAVKEKEFLEGLASSVGGKLVSTPNLYRIDLEPKIFRSQWLAFYDGYNNEIGTATLNKLDRDLRKSAIDLMSDKILVAVMSAPDNNSEIPIPAESPAAQIAKKYLAAYGSEATNTKLQARDSELKARRETLSHVDMSKPFLFRIEPLGFITLWCRGRAKGEYVQF